MTWPLSSDPGAFWTMVWVLDTGPALCVEPPFLALAPPPPWTSLILSVLLSLLLALSRAQEPCSGCFATSGQVKPLGNVGAPNRFCTSREEFAASNP